MALVFLFHSKRSFSKNDGYHTSTILIVCMLPISSCLRSALSRTDRTGRVRPWVSVRQAGRRCWSHRISPTPTGKYLRISSLLFEGSSHRCDVAELIRSSFRWFCPAYSEIRPESTSEIEFIRQVRAGIILWRSRATIKAQLKQCQEEWTERNMLLLAELFGTRPDPLEPADQTTI